VSSSPTTDCGTPETQPPHLPAVSQRGESRYSGTTAKPLPPSSSLEHLESNPPPADSHINHPRYGPSDAHSLPPIWPEESGFRHSCWHHRRRLVYNALMSSGQSSRRIDAFANCGAGAWAQVSASGDDVRVVAHHCHDRFCQPCQVGRAASIVAAVTEHLKTRTTRFVTLTQRASDTPLPDQLNKLYRDFSTLRRREWWKRRVTGGAAFLEVKIGENSGLWHCHLHILVEGDYLPQRELAAEWYAVTGASYICHVTAVPNAEHRARYVTKYVTKPADPTVFADPAKLALFVAALKGRRLCLTFGGWRGLQLDPDSPTDEQWKSIAPLTQLFSDAAHGDAAALRWVEALQRKYPSLAAAFGRPPPDAPTLPSNG
jgi:hypothetical protein